MSEFLFKNLSVKLFPVEAADRGDCPDCTFLCVGDSQFHCRAPSVVCGFDCSRVVSCGNACSASPTREPPVCDLACSTIPTCALECSNIPTGRGCFRSCSNVPSPPCLCSNIRCTLPGDIQTFLMAVDPGGDVRAELAVLKDRLRENLAAVEAREQELEAAARPKTVEEIDTVRSHLLAAVAELDEQRAELEGRRPPPE